jgi:hypothetical protein
MLTSTACRFTACQFVLFFFLSPSANGEKGGLRILAQSESTVDTSKGLAVVGADDAHRMLLEPTNHTVDPEDCGDDVGCYIIDYIDLGAKILVPGTYNAGESIGLNGDLTLVGAGGGASLSTDHWTIIIDGAFTTTALSTMAFDVGGAGSFGNVLWQVIRGDITLGADSTAVGSMQSFGAMTMGAGSPFTFDGDATFDVGGALSMAANSSMNMTPDAITENAEVIWNVYGGIDIGANSHAVGNMFSTAGAITLGASASSGNLDAYGAITLGAGDLVVVGNLRAGGGINVGASAHTGTLSAGGEITVGAAADVGDTCDYPAGDPCK